ncbi:MAG: hypothetical protein M0P99_05875, partial [Candidatus Cloacimonetes bacterium]|nr:hypothetical protein [Candidatus Cloacimonadota bacterium]
MRLDRRRAILLLLLAFTVLATVIIAQKQNDKDQYVVENFQVQDVQADDGSGLVLSWKPLERTKRVIEYRIYRGVSPDKLFFLDAIPVNVKSGVASDKMYYYDNAGSEFIDIASPRHLKKEKQQDDKSPLYRKLPRDIPFLASIADKYSLLSLVDKGKYYYSSKQFTTDKPETPGADGKLPETGVTYAGLKDNQQSVLCFLKPGEKYYYTVVAVNERNKYQKPAEITSGTPIPNAPDPSPALYSVVLKDTKTAQFEWEYPLYKDDIAQYRIHQLPAISDTAWAAMDKTPETLQGRTNVVAQGGVGSGTLKNYTTLPLPTEEAVAAFENARYSI